MKTFFVSSTFRDMHSERDCMHKAIIPKLNDTAFKYGETIAICDLRWGVNTAGKDSDEADRKVLSVCMNEIDACRPYFIILFGERYGFCPGKELIEEEIEKRNRQAEAAGRSAFSLPKDHSDISITELEIQYGALFAVRPKVLCYRREFVNAEEVPDDFKEKSENGKTKLSALKESVKKLAELPGEDVIVRSYPARWNSEKGRVEFLEDENGTFSEMVERDVIQLMQEEWKKTGSLTAGQRERNRHWEYARIKEKDYFVREVLDRSIEERLEQGHFAVIRGKAGCGKSSVMSHLAIKFKSQDNTEVLALFCGYTPLTCSGLDLIKRIVEYLEEILGKTETANSEWDDHAADWKEWRLRMEQRITQFSEWAQERGRRLVILVDAVDQLEATEIRDSLLFIPSNLSSQVRMVISCVEEFKLASGESSTVDVEPLQDKEKGEVLRKMFESLRREGYCEVMEEIKHKQNSDNPLYLSLLVQRLEMMEQEDFRRIDAGNSYNDTVVKYQNKILNKCPDNLQEMCAALLDEAATRIGGKLAEKVVSYLSASRYGLRETDLEGIFGTGWNRLEFSGFYKYMRRLFIVREDGRYDFSHGSIRKGYQAKYESKQAELHREILEYLKTLPSYDAVRISELPYHCYRTDDKAFLVKYLCWEEQDKKLDEARREAALEAAARGVHEICIMDAEWMCSVLNGCNPWERPKEAAGVLCFLYKYLGRTFEGVNTELEIQKKVYGESLRLAEKLHQELQNENSMQILADICYYLGNVCLRLGGAWNYSRALELYQREQELVYALSREEKEGAAVRQADSLIHLGDIYASMGGRENRNRALRLYRKAREKAEQCGAKKKEKDVGRKIGEILAKGGSKQQKEARDIFAASQEVPQDERPSLSERKKEMYSYIRMGDAQLRMRGAAYWEEALGYYQKAGKLAENRKAEPPVEENLYDWLICRERLGFMRGILEKKPPLPELRENYWKCCGIWKEMEGRWRKERLYRVQIVLAEQEGSLLMRLAAGGTELQAAREKFLAAEAAARKLCKLRNDGYFQRDLLVICCKLGDVSVKMEVGNQFPERTLEKIIRYYKEAFGIAKRLKKELGTEESRMDYMVVNTRIGDLFAFLGGEKLCQMAEARYLQSLDEAISLYKERRLAVNMMDVSVLCGKIAAVSRDGQIQAFMKERSRRAKEWAQRAADVDFDGENSFEPHCHHLAIEDK